MIIQNQFALYLRLNGEEFAPAHQGKPVRPLPSSPPSFALCEGGSEESELSLSTAISIFIEEEGRQNRNAARNWQRNGIGGDF
jgi:hypothetical protein